MGKNKKSRGKNNNNKELFLREIENRQSLVLEHIEPKEMITLDNITTCAGVDVTYYEYRGIEYGICSVVVLDIHTLDVIEKVSEHGVISIPYTTGYLSNREIPLIVQTYNKLKSRPDIILVDGPGKLHDRQAGEAVILGHILETPTVGVSKSPMVLNVCGLLSEDIINNRIRDISIDGDVYGRAYTSKGTVKPIYISEGYGATLGVATELVKLLIRDGNRIPDPTRLADLDSRKRVMDKKIELGITKPKGDKEKNAESTKENKVVIDKNVPVDLEVSINTETSSKAKTHPNSDTKDNTETTTNTESSTIMKPTSTKKKKKKSKKGKR